MDVKCLKGSSTTILLDLLSGLLRVTSTNGRFVIAIYTVSFLFPRGRIIVNCTGCGRFAVQARTG